MMQTFMPYSSFQETAEALDWKRLGKQRVECKQILQAATGETAAYSFHPAAAMWRGYEKALVAYALACCEEYAERGYNSEALTEYFTNALYDLVDGTGEAIDLPPWLHDQDVLSSHRSNLFRKDPEHYQKFGFDAARLNMAYIWPEPIGLTDEYTVRLSRPDAKRILKGERSLSPELAWYLVPAKISPKYSMPTLTRRYQG